MRITGKGMPLLLLAAVLAAPARTAWSREEPGEVRATLTAATADPATGRVNLHLRWQLAHPGFDRIEFRIAVFDAKGVLLGRRRVTRALPPEASTGSLSTWVGAGVFPDPEGETWLVVQVRCQRRGGSTRIPAGTLRQRLEATR